MLRDPCRDFGSAFREDVGNDDVGAGLCQGERDGAADARAAAGDDGDLIGDAALVWRHGSSSPFDRQFAAKGEGESIA